jgi:hypothetical protein
VQTQPHAHPAKGALAMARISNSAVAREKGFSEHYVSRCLNGWEKPSPRFRRAVAEMLGTPESELFFRNELSCPEAVQPSLQEPGREAHQEESR